MITVDTDAVLVFAALVFVTCMIVYVGGFMWMRKLDRDDVVVGERFERRLEELLRR